MNYKKNCLTYWLPKLIGLKIPVPIPKTIGVDMDKVDKNFIPAMRKMFWMKDLSDKDKTALSKFRNVLEKMAEKIGGYPFFLRTGQTSHKHNWNTTCYIKDRAALFKNAQALAEYSIMADFKKGLPINVWVARKLLEVEPAFIAFEGMPITKEFRYFIKNGKIQCSHPYWPEHALKGHIRSSLNWQKKLSELSKITANEVLLLKEMTQHVASEFKGYWSVDWLKAKNGWYLIDMGRGEDSWHWPSCKFSAKKEK